MLFESEVMRLSEDLLYKDILARGRGALPDESADGKLSETEREAMRTADEVVTRLSLKERLCPALTSIAGDVLEIAKVVTAGLMPLTLSGAIPKEAMLFAAVSVIITRAGVSAFCKGVTK